MESDDEEFAVASHIAYKNYDTNQVEAQKELDYYLDGYKLDTEFGSDDIATTIIKPDGSAIIAFKGTNSKNIFDLTADMLVSGGYHRLKPQYQFLPNTRFSNAEDYYKIVKQKHPEIHLTGHSLGGSVATHIASKYNQKATIFNSGETPQDLNSPYFNSENEMIKSYIVPSDLISMSNRIFNNQNTILVNRKIKSGYKYTDSHRLDNFLPDKKDKTKNEIKNEIEKKRESVVENINDECPPYYKKCDKSGTDCKCIKPKPKTTFSKKMI